MPWRRTGNKTLPGPMLTNLSHATWLHYRPSCFNSLAPRKFEWNFRYEIFKEISVIDGWSISCEIALIWMSLDFTDDQSTLVQVMTWCRQATSHCLSQCWPRSLTPHDLTTCHHALNWLLQFCMFVLWLHALLIFQHSSWYFKLGYVIPWTNLVYHT